MARKASNGTVEAAPPTKARRKSKPLKATPGVRVRTQRGQVVDQDRYGRGIHTAYFSDEDSGRDDAGNFRKHKVQDFYKGRAESVPGPALEQLRREGLCRR